jgi:hypothetical protein
MAGVNHPSGRALATDARELRSDSIPGLEITHVYVNLNEQPIG